MWSIEKGRVKPFLTTRNTMQIYDYDHDSILVRLHFKEARVLGGSLYVALGAGDQYP